MKFPSFHSKLNIFLTLLFITCLPLAASAQENTEISHKFSLGSYLSGGKYGAQENTDIVYFPLTYELSRFPWVLSVTVPYLGLKGPGDVFLETGNIGRPSTVQDEAVDESGLGDVFVSATYQLPSLLKDSIFVDFSLQAKLPTADEKRDLGTGETDYGAQLDFYNTRERNTYFATIGYRWRGRTPLYNLQDSAHASMGAMRQYGESTYLGLIYDYREKASGGSFDSHEIMPFISYNLSTRWNLMVYTIQGFTDSSADQTLGIQISLTLP
jgi:hypothetical protein